MRIIASLVLILSLVACGNVDTASNVLDNRENKLVSKVKVIAAKDLELSKDKATILSSRLEGNKLYLTVQYGGGSKDHEFELYCLNVLAKSRPPKASLYLSHDAKGDFAKALIKKELIFELGSMDSLNKGAIALRIFAPGQQDAEETNLLYQQ